MDRHAEPSQVIANGLPALEVREARQKSLKLKMLRFFQWATRFGHSSLGEFAQYSHHSNR